MDVQSLAFAHDDSCLTTITPQAYHSCTGGKKLWAPLEEALSQPFLWNVTPYPHLSFFSLPPAEPTLQRQHSPINTRACVRVSVLFPQSLDGSDVAAAQLSAEGGPSSVSLTLYPLPALRCPTWG